MLWDHILIKTWDNYTPRLVIDEINSCPTWDNYIHKTLRYMGFLLFMNAL